VASFKLRVVPHTARVLLDGRLLEPSDWAQPIVVNVGEHSLSVDAPGYAPERRVLRVAGGHKDIPVNVELRCVSGFVDVTSNDPTAYIAINGLPKARRAYKGPWSGHRAFAAGLPRRGGTLRATFQVGVCRTLALRAELEGVENAPRSDGDEPGSALPGAPPRNPRLDFMACSHWISWACPASHSAWTFRELRGERWERWGYGPLPPIQPRRAGLDAGRRRAGGHRRHGHGSDNVRRDYSLRSIHFGPNLKLMTTGERLRFVTTIGAGIVHHRLAVEASDQFRAAEARGFDPYFLLELGMGFSFRHFLGEIGLIALIDGPARCNKAFRTTKTRG
jgi:hypothetical protein